METGLVSGGSETSTHASQNLQRIPHFLLRTFSDFGFVLGDFLWSGLGTGLEDNGDIKCLKRGFGVLFPNVWIRGLFRAISRDHVDGLGGFGRR